MMLSFFLSSRRRHTRFDCDWSSDVCSSDCLTAAGALEASEADVSSLMDTWLLLKTIEVGGERNRALYVLKSRGMEHSNQIREFVLTGDGLRLLDVYLGPEGVLTGSARVTQEGREKAAGTSRQQQLDGRGRELDRKRQIFEARMTMLRAEFEVEEANIQQTMSEATLLDTQLLRDREQMVRSREADAAAHKGNGQTLKGNGQTAKGNGQAAKGNGYAADVRAR